MPGAIVIPRVDETAEYLGPIDAGAPLSKIGTHSVVGLPDESDGTYLIVSRMVAERLPHRRDLIFPFGLLRDGDGKIIGAQQFGCV